MPVEDGEAGGRVGDGEAQDGPGEGASEPAGEPAVQGPVLDGAAFGVAGADDDFSQGGGVEEGGEVFGAVGEVGVHHDDEVSVGGVEAIEHGGGEAQFAGALQQEDAWVQGGALLDDTGGAVRAGIVDDDDLVVVEVEDFGELVQQGSDVRHFVVGGNDDGEGLLFWVKVMHEG